MFYVSMEFRKGILFIRFNGRLDNEGYLEYANNIIEDMGIRLIVFNIDNVHDLSVCDIDNINKYNGELLKKKKMLYICDANKYRSKLFKYIPKISKEIEIFSLI